MLRTFLILLGHLPALFMAVAAIYFAIHRDNAEFLALLFLVPLLWPKVLEKSDA